MGTIKKLIDDSVNGQIIGGDYGMAWVTYCGRKQGKTVYPHNEVEAESMCQSIIDEIKLSCGDAFSIIYPLNEWKFHFDGL